MDTVDLTAFRVLALFGLSWLIVPGQRKRLFIPFMGKRIGCLFWPRRVLAKVGLTPNR